MTEYTEDDIIYGQIAYARQGVPTGKFTLDKSATAVVPDDTIIINGNYTTKKSYIYPATYTFKTDVIGSEPSGWTTNNSSTCTSTIIQTINDHNKILQLYDGNGSGIAQIHRTVNQSANQRIEMWLAKSSIAANKDCIIEFYESATLITSLRLQDNDLDYYTSSAWSSVDDDFIVADTFFHIMMILNDSANTFDIYIDGSLEGNDLAYENSSTVSIDKILFETDSADTGYYFYIDAIGINSETSYTSGDNINWENYKDSMGEADFEGEELYTEDDSIGFIDSFSGSGSCIIKPLYDEHKKILNCTGEHTWSNTFSSGQTSGTIEFYFRYAVSNGYVINLYDEGSAIAFAIREASDYFEHFDNGGWSSQDVACVADTWYHIKIVFDCSDDSYTYYVDAVSEGTGTMASSPTTLIKIEGIIEAETGIIRPDTDDATGSWAHEGGGNFYEDIDDDVEEPDAGDGTDIYTSTNLDNISFEMEDVNKTPTSGKWWCRLYSTGLTAEACDSWIDYNDGGGWTQLSQFATVYGGYAWKSQNITSGKLGMGWKIRLRAVSPNPDSIYVDAMYIEWSIAASSTDVDFDAFGFSWETDYEVGDNLETTVPETSYNTIIFDGRIEDVDMKDAQGIYCIGKAQEILQLRPSTTIYGKTGYIISSLTYNNCNFVGSNISQTTGQTLDLWINGDVTQGDWEDTTGGDNDADNYDEIDEQSYNPSTYTTDGNYIRSTGINPGTFALTTHSLSTDYTYEIYKVWVEFYLRASSINHYINVWFKASDWSKKYRKKMSSVNWTNSGVFQIEDISANEDDIADFRIKIGEATAGYYFDIDACNVDVYYQYYDSDGDIHNGSYKTELVLNSEKTIKNIYDWGALTELKTWYLDNDDNLFFNDGDVFSGINIISTNNIKNIRGNRKIKSFDKVVLYGGYVGGNRITSTSGSGNIIAKETYNDITDQTRLDILAAQILSEKGANKYDISMIFTDSTIGLPQVGETVNIASGIKFDGSSTTIPTNDYIMDEVVLHLSKGGVFNHAKVKLIDFLTFSIPEEVQTAQNTKSSRENSTSVSQMASSKASVYIKITNPTVNDDLDLGYLVGDLWVNSVDSGLFVCLDNSDGEADWNEITTS